MTEPSATHSSDTAGTDSLALATLKLRLIGRICIVKHQGAYVALFLDARHNRRLALQKHRAVFCGPVERITPNIVRKGDVAFGDPTGAASALWSIKGYDLLFDGLVEGDQVCTSLEETPSLNKIYAKIDPHAAWRSAENLLRSADPRPFGIAARVSLAGFHTIRAAAPPSAEATDRRYYPGEHRQRVHGMVECIGHFRKSDDTVFSIRGESFDGCMRPCFDVSQEHDIALSMSNICACIGEPNRRLHPGDPDWELDDDEFTLMYELLAKPPESASGRPLPYREQKGGGGGVPECYVPGSLEIPEG